MSKIYQPVYESGLAIICNTMLHDVTTITPWYILLHITSVRYHEAETLLAPESENYPDFHNYISLS